MESTSRQSALSKLASAVDLEGAALGLQMAISVVAFSVAMFGQSRAPYAFFLTGMTYIVIASNSQTDPAMSSHYALLRIEEVGLGVVVSMVVQVVVFPRYAVTAFRKLVRASLAEIADMLPLVAGRFAGTNADFGQAMRDFPAKSTQMRMMLRFGAMESRSFRRDIVRNTQKSQPPQHRRCPRPIEWLE